MMLEYVPILIMMILATLIALLIVGASHLLGNRISNRIKLSTYECGMQTIGPTRMKINIRYYIVAMLFLIFDIEIMFLYPWAVMAGNLKLFGFFIMLFFVIILLIGYIYLWKKGALEWQ
jgi:NADH-quinone oxidoreductase subunit A